MPIGYGETAMIVKQQTFVARQKGGMDIMLHPIIYLCEDFSCMNVGQCNDGRVGVSLLEEAWLTNNVADNAKAALAIKCCRIQ